jgi:lipopolysaccharide export system permease protein
MTFYSYFSGSASGYLSKQFLYWFIICAVSLMIIIGFFEGIETLRRVMHRPDIPLSVVLELTLLRLPRHMVDLMPFMVFLGSLFSLWKLNQNSEVLALRATGISGVQISVGLAITSVCIGIFSLFILNPLSAALSARYSSIEETVLKRNQHRMAISSTGFWLKEVRDQQKIIVHARSFNVGERTFSDVTFYEYDGDDHFVKRIDASCAELKDFKWSLSHALVWNKEKMESTHTILELPTSLTLEKIKESTTQPEHIPFWRIPAFIRYLEKNGLSSLTYLVYWHRLWAELVLLSMMAVLAVGFCLPTGRYNATSRLIALALISGFFIHFLNSIVHALGLSERLSPFWSAWIPPLVTGLFGFGYLMHAEEKA